MFGIDMRMKGNLESICNRLKQRFENYRDDWQIVVNNDTNEKNARDFQFIQYIVNFIIEQAKHNIVISELPEIIRMLHHETEMILQKNRMVTLQQIITQVQIIGARKYPYLKKVKPITIEDFVREVLREVFDRLGTLITLDMIENICQLTTCSAKQLLRTIPNIDVSDAATLIIEDISRNQLYKKSKPVLFSDLETIKQAKVTERKLENMSAPVRKERISSKRDLLNSKQSIGKNQNSITFQSKKHSLINRSSPSIRYYSKHAYQYSDISDNEEKISEIDTETCPLEDILNHRIPLI